MDPAGHFPTEVFRNVARYPDKLGEKNLFASAGALERVNEVLGSDVTSHHLRKRTSAQTGKGCFEARNTGSQRSVYIGHAEPVCIMEVAGALNVRRKVVDGGEHPPNLGRVRVTGGVGKTDVGQPCLKI